MAAASAPASSSLKEYLRKYEAGGVETQKKKKKKKKAAKSAGPAGGILIFDEDPVWAKPVEPEAEEESAEEETPVVDEDIEVKRLKRLEQLRTRKPYHAISEDGSGWVSISDAPKRPGSPAEAPDLSPPRQRRARLDTPSPGREDARPSDGDLSPPRQRRRRYDSPSPEPETRPSAVGLKDRPGRTPPRRMVPSEDTSPPRRIKELSDELSPPRTSNKGAVEDLSPPRRGRKFSPDGLDPPRRGAKDIAEDPPPPRERRRGSPDLSQSRRGRKDSPVDLSPPRRARKDSVVELSPIWKGKKDSSEDLSPPRRGRDDPTPDLSPPRKQRNNLIEDLPLPRRARHHLRDGNKQRQSADDDLSPPRRKEGFAEGFSSPNRSRNPPDTSVSPSRESMKKPLPAKVNPRAGLFTGREIKQDIQKKKTEEIMRLAALDPSLSGKGAEPVYREKGRRISKEELLKAQEGDQPKEKKLEWGKGLAQKREAETRALELELEKEKPFARSRDDPELDKMLRERPRWGDPMAHLVKKKHSEPMLEDFSTDEKMKESGFIIPQTIPIHSWIKRGIEPTANRYGIQPGRHWDGVDRSNGYEKEMFKRQNERRATETEAYLWSVSDM